MTAAGPQPIPEPVTKRVYARVGLLGNPSDGFKGAVVSFSLQNFWAEVRARPNEKLVLEPHPEHDPSGFGDVAALSTHVAGFGCHGGVRLLMAACHCFARYAADRGLALPSRTFALSYETCIPRQSGLSGSSAIVLATLWCLLDIHGLGEDARAAHDMPYVALQAEQSLGITAGLQDRLIQTYEGCLLMDFSGAGRPALTVIDTAGKRIQAPLPALWLIYDPQPSGKDSGSVHSTVKERWERGDETVRRGMQELAEVARLGARALVGDGDLGALMRRNFALRRALYGAAALGPRSTHMVEVAEAAGCAAKFAGSGGAVVVLSPGPREDAELARACAHEGFACLRALVGAPQRAPPEREST